jgi:hypothetical protein
MSLAAWLVLGISSAAGANRYVAGDPAGRRSGRLWSEGATAEQEGARK